MNDQTARLVHWLSDGRSAAIVAPAVRAATSPAARGVMLRSRTGARLEGIDIDRARAVAERLGGDPEFRRAVAVAADRVRRAAARPRRRRFRRIVLVVGAVAAVAALIRASMRRDAVRPHRPVDAAGAAGVTGRRDPVPAAPAS